ncbi:MAG: response regulator [Anaerolineae bacterium]|nr:response regulator [Anaerolineae bacterium]
MNNPVTNLTNSTILIVDDNPANLGVIADYLETYNFNIFTAMDGKDALQVVRMVNPDLILLDIMMPGMDGFEVCHRLKADEATQKIPVIFMTALAGTEDKVKGFTAGAVDYITKPINQEEVLARIRTHLTLRLQSLQLQTLNATLAKRAAQLEISSQVAQQVTSILDLDTLLVKTVQLTQAQFNYYCVGVWLINEARDGLVLRAFASQGSPGQFETGFTIAVDARPSIIAHACRTQASYLTNNAQRDPHYFFWEAFPDTHAELVLPLHFGEMQYAEYTYFGVLDIQDTQTDAFTPEDVTVLQALANQIAVAIRNAQLYAEIILLNRVSEEA